MEQTHDTPSHDDEVLDNVIPIHGDETGPDDDDGGSGADTEVLDIGITEEILTTDLIGGIRGYVDMSRKYLESSTSSITPTQLNDYMADNYEDSLTEEQRIAMAEFDVMYCSPSTVRLPPGASRASSRCGRCSSKRSKTTRSSLSKSSSS